MKATREREFWTPAPLYAGKTVFVIGGGPSLRGFDFDRLTGLRVLATNVAAYDVERLLPEPDWFFIDPNIYDDNTALVQRWPGRIFTASRRAKGQMPDRLFRIDQIHRPDFALPGSSVIRSGRTSGHVAISLAVTMGAARIVMLGFDMRLEAGRSHYHDRYKRGPDDPAIYVREFLPSFEGWHRAGRAAGCEIVNATPDSAVIEFPHVDLDDEIAAARATCTAP